MQELTKKEKENGALEYTKAKLEEVGELETPCAGVMYSPEEMLMLFDLAKEDRCKAVTYALCIGFANGVKHKAGGLIA